MAVEIPVYKLKSGGVIPILGLGTWNLTGKICIDSVRKAIELGYTHIDTAEVYGNHKEIGKAIRDFDRSKIFITTKVWRDDLRHDDVLKACNRALNELDTDYLDLYLIHWPNREVPVEETLNAMKELRDADKIRSIGVSNFTIRHLQEALEVGVDISINQVEFHPHLYQKELLDFCREKGIVITAYSPLGRGEVLKDKTLIELAEKHSRTPVQISLKWLLQKSMVVIPKASSEEHLRQNIDISSWKLAEDDVKRIDNIGITKRIVDFQFSEF